MRKASESSPEFLNMIRQWQGLEDKTIQSAGEMIKKTNNPLIKMTMEIIKHDSEKHKVIQQMIIDNLTKESVHLSPEELDSLGDMLNRHIDLEEQSVAMATEALKNSEVFITNYLLSYLIADETKHHTILGRLNDELKRAAVPTSTSSRYYGTLDRPPSSIERSQAPRASH